MKKIFFTIIGTTIALVLFLAVSEFGVRMAGIAPQVPSLHDQYVSDEKLTYQMAPNVDLEEKTDEFHVRYKNNNWGFRDDVDYPTPDSESKFRIAVIGDSFSYGIGVDKPQNFPTQLQTKLGNQDFQIYNLGQPGYYTELENLILQKYGSKLKPQLIILQFITNDVIDQIEVGTKVVTDGVLLKRSSVFLGPFGIHLYQKSHLFRTLYKAFEIYYFKNDLFHSQNRWAEVFKVGGDLEPIWTIIFSNLDEIKRTADYFGAPLVLTFVPSYEQWTQTGWENVDQRLKDWAKNSRSHYLSLFQPFSNHFKQTELPTHYKTDGHCNPLGNEIIANQIYDYITRMELVPKPKGQPTAAHE